MVIPIVKGNFFANNRHFGYDNENDLVDFIASEMQKGELDPNDD